MVRISKKAPPKRSSSSPTRQWSPGGTNFTISKAEFERFLNLEKEKARKEGAQEVLTASQARKPGTPVDTPRKRGRPKKSLPPNDVVTPVVSPPVAGRKRGRPKGSKNAAPLDRVGCVMYTSSRGRKTRITLVRQFIPFKTTASASEETVKKRGRPKSSQVKPAKRSRGAVLKGDVKAKTAVKAGQARLTGKEKASVEKKTNRRGNSTAKCSSASTVAKRIQKKKAKTSDVVEKKANKRGVAASSKRLPKNRTLKIKTSDVRTTKRSSKAESSSAPTFVAKRIPKKKAKASEVVKKKAIKKVLVAQGSNRLSQMRTPKIKTSDGKSATKKLKISTSVTSVAKRIPKKRAPNTKALDGKRVSKKSKNTTAKGPSRVPVVKRISKKKPKTTVDTTVTAKKRRVTKKAATTAKPRKVTRKTPSSETKEEKTVKEEENEEQTAADNTESPQTVQPQPAQQSRRTTGPQRAYYVPPDAPVLPLPNIVGIALLNGKDKMKSILRYIRSYWNYYREDQLHKMIEDSITEDDPYVGFQKPRNNQQLGVYFLKEGNQDDFKKYLESFDKHRANELGIEYKSLWKKFRTGNLQDFDLPDGFLPTDADLDEYHCPTMAAFMKSIIAETFESQKKRMQEEAESEKEPCVLCEGHWGTEVCTRYKTVNERTERFQELNMCPYCQGPSHSRSETYGLCAIRVVLCNFCKTKEHGLVLCPRLFPDEEDE